MATLLPPVNFNSTQDTSVPFGFCGSTRTLTKVIWSCIATIVACTWIAIHPNIPETSEKWWKTTLRRMTIMLCAILAPEFIIWWALRQWKGARALKERFRLYKEVRGWTLAHAYFLQMGGFMLQTDSSVQAGVLSPETFFHLLATNQINCPRISEDEIQDRSKSDAFAKAVASLQTCWFVAQIIGRGVQHLPVTELEIVTLGYAVLNGAVYFLWWHKPLNVACPVTVFLKQDAIYPPKQKALPDLPVNVDDISGNVITTELEDANKEESRSTRAITPVQEGPTSTDVGDPIGCIPYPLQILGGIILVPLIPAIALALIGLGLAIGAAVLAFALAIAIASLVFAIVVLTIAISTQGFLIPIGFKYQEMMFADTVADGALHVPTYYAYNPNLSLHDLERSPQADSVHFGDLEAREMNEDNNDLGEDSERLEYEDLDLFVSGVLSIIFGSIHLIAWSFQFPTSTECTVWRICAVSVTCVPAAVMLKSIIRLATLLKLRGETSSSFMRTRRGRFGGSLLLNAFLAFCWNLYAFARIGLLVLAVIGLRNLPITTFLAVRWAEFLPHYQ